MLFLGGTSSVFSVIYFINIVLNLSFLLFLNNLEFFGILLIIVYIGAILVLFLFVIMMLNIVKIEEINYFSFRFILFFLIYIFNILFWIIHIQQTTEEITINSIFINFFYELNSLFTVEILGLLLFTYYLFLFIIITLILFVSMFGSIALVYTKSTGLYKEIKSFKALERPINSSIWIVTISNKRCIY
jgi:NADH:ubiquinone oxidoreductase subunit 6 (subunit J)